MYNVCIMYVHVCTSYHVFFKSEMLKFEFCLECTKVRNLQSFSDQHIGRGREESGSTGLLSGGILGVSFLGGGALSGSVLGGSFFFGGGGREFLSDEVLGGEVLRGEGGIGWELFGWESF